MLLGDAAHAVSAAFGQGVNSALEVNACRPLVVSKPRKLFSCHLKTALPFTNSGSPHGYSGQS